MNYQQQQYPYQQPYMYPNQGYGFVNRPPAKFTQPLTEQEAKELNQREAIQAWQITQEDALKAKCTHKRNGQLTLVPEPDGYMRCTECQTRFHMCDMSTDEVQAVTNSFLDILNTIKTMYIDAPDSLIIQYFQMLPLIAKAPLLWDKASTNVKLYDHTDMSGVAPIFNGINPFAMVNNMMTNPYQFMAPAPQTMYGAPQGYGVNPGYMAGPQGYVPQPQMQQQPQQAPAPMYQQPDPNAVQAGMPFGVNPQYPIYNQQPQNPFVYGTPAYPQVPVAPNPGVPQMQQQPQQAPAQQPQGEQVVQHKSFEV